MSCYVAGVPIDDIRRFGRWKSCVFSRYIHREELMYLGLIRHISRTDGFLDRTKQSNAATKSEMVDAESELTEFRTGGVRDSENRWVRFRTCGSTIFDSEGDSEDIGNRQWGNSASDVETNESAFSMEMVDTVYHPGFEMVNGPIWLLLLHMRYDTGIDGIPPNLFAIRKQFRVFAR